MTTDPACAPEVPPRRAIDDPVVLERGARIFRMALAREAARREREAADHGITEQSAGDK
jgi:hypothetical protein